ncbi:unnamed protein product [Clavelina lepadiformis]|uniref:Uncharacterized protein n=1 Tax=Clavelina lepadiformis TaxID=159417 RepID=A0ABP0GSZ3_CLALP
MKQYAANIYTTCTVSGVPIPSIWRKPDVHIYNPINDMIWAAQRSEQHWMLQLVMPYDEWNRERIETFDQWAVIIENEKIIGFTTKWSNRDLHVCVKGHKISELRLVLQDKFSLDKCSFQSVRHPGFHGFHLYHSTTNSYVSFNYDENSFRFIRSRRGKWGVPPMESSSWVFG